MYTKADFLNNLTDLNIDSNGTLMVHLSYKAIGDVDGRGDTVLDALMDYMHAGLLVLPAHTWDNVSVENPVMDVIHTPTTKSIGLLTEVFRKRKGVLRSLHPTHSLAAIGKDAKEFLSGEEHIKTPCGKHGAYYKLWERNAQILMIGCNFVSNTFIHGLEEWEHAEGAISKEKTDLYVIDYDSKRDYTPQYRHCSHLGSFTFSKIEPYAYKEGVLTFGNFGDASTRLMRTKSLRELVAPFIKENPRYLLHL
jgi:aminoglycoside 3-N-acetyltransferase